MKKILLCIIASAALAFAENYYDQYGHSTGRSSTNGNQTQYYDQYGHNTGRSSHGKNQSVHYDQYGHILAELPIMATSPRSMTSTDITQAELSETGTQSTIMTNMGTARDAPKSTMTVL